ncbi:hypothetical protein IAU60_001412 [Kwoniella sp. DSM 27419]
MLPISDHSKQANAAFTSTLDTVIKHVTDRHANLHATAILPTGEAIAQTNASLPVSLPARGLGTDGAISYLIDSILPGILQAQNGPRYFGFVVGGVTPAAQLADMLATSYDENVQVNLHQQTASTAIEQRTLELVLDLLDIDRSKFMGRTLTTGATACNVLGLACARDYLYAHSPHLPSSYSYAQDGPPSAPGLPSPPIIILSLHPHFSIQKASALVGLGSSSRIIQTVPPQAHDELAFDLDILEGRLREEQAVGRGVIVVYGVGEVNTGSFGNGQGLADVAALCRTHGAWLHVDAAFGGFAGLMPELRDHTKHMDQADSLTLDGHKWLNVPYDCGIFYTKHASALTNIFQPPSASAPAYLASGSAPSSAGVTDSAIAGTVNAADVPSPLFVGLENSRRFRALPLLASLLSLGKEGYQDIITRNVLFARKVAAFLSTSPSYDLLNPTTSHPLPTAQTPAIIPSNIVLFRGSSDSPFPPSDPASAASLTSRINGSSRMYVSATRWRGEACVRLAVSNYLTGSAEGGPDVDFDIVREVLERVGRGEEVKFER